MDTLQPCQPPHPRCPSPWFEGCDLLGTVSAEELGEYEHLDYAPLINARAHRLGQRREILNGSFAAQYKRLLHMLCHKPRLADADWMAVAGYLLLQVRREMRLPHSVHVTQLQDLTALHIRTCSVPMGPHGQPSARRSPMPTCHFLTDPTSVIAGPPQGGPGGICAGPPGRVRL